MVLTKAINGAKGFLDSNGAKAINGAKLLTQRALYSCILAEKVFLRN
jgi:hypothetical protein